MQSYFIHVSQQQLVSLVTSMCMKKSQFRCVSDADLSAYVEGPSLHQFQRQTFWFAGWIFVSRPGFVGANKQINK